MGKVIAEFISVIIRLILIVLFIVCIFKIENLRKEMSRLHSEVAFCIQLNSIILHNSQPDSKTYADSILVIDSSAKMYDIMFDTLTYADSIAYKAR